MTSAALEKALADTKTPVPLLLSWGVPVFRKRTLFLARALSKYFVNISDIAKLATISPRLPVSAQEPPSTP